MRIATKARMDGWPQDSIGEWRAEDSFTCSTAIHRGEHSNSQSSLVSSSRTRMFCTRDRPLFASMTNGVVCAVSFWRVSSQPPSGQSPGETDIQRRYREKDAALESYGDYDEVVFWFEHDLYDQLLLIRHLCWLSRS